MGKRKQTNNEKQEIQKKQKQEQQQIIQDLNDMANLMRIQSIQMTNKSSSGHPTSCSSIAEMLACLFFSKEGMQLDTKELKNKRAERLVLSKGHAAPILYSAWHQAGVLSQEQLDSLRKIDSNIEGHPTPDMEFVDVATGSLGQGMGVAAGIAYSNKHLDKNQQFTYCIVGDGELAEGSNWEAALFASHYKLNNLVVFADINKLGQSTQIGDQSKQYHQKFTSFGWNSMLVDGHNVTAILKALQKAKQQADKPSVLVCQTLKGKNMGSVVEDNMGYHGKPLADQSEIAIKHLQSLVQNKDLKMQVNEITSDQNTGTVHYSNGIQDMDGQESMFVKGNKLATRQAYGQALNRLGRTENDVQQQLVVLDADTKNSTFSIEFMKEHADRFIECFICEQNMVSVALGIQARNKIPFISTFSAFLTRCFDQIRIAGLSGSNLKICGSHSGCSIGDDGTTQMGLEDLSMMRSVANSVVLYPSDPVSMERAVQLVARQRGVCYIRSTRQAFNDDLYSQNETFAIGKSKVLHQSDNGKCVIITAGATLQQAIDARQQLNSQGVNVGLIDLFSVKPIDTETILEQAQKANNNIVIVEDHYKQGGIYEAVCSELINSGVKVYSVHVTRVPKSGKPLEVMQFTGITSKFIQDKVLSL